METGYLEPDSSTTAAETEEVYHAIAEANKSPSLLVFPEERNLLPENDVVIQITFIGPNSQAPARLDLVKGDTSLNLAPANWQGKTIFSLCAVKSRVDALCRAQ